MNFVDRGTAVQTADEKPTNPRKKFDGVARKVILLIWGNSYRLYPRGFSFGSRAVKALLACSCIFPRSIGLPCRGANA
jgi:hypothetical protein